MVLSLLPHHGPTPRPQVLLPGGLGLGLVRGRVHELCGPARTSLAALLMGQCDGPVLWIMPGWQPERLYPPGFALYADPGRIIFARARRPEDIQWTLEEALRSGAIPLVVAELPDVPGLTPVRRLNLAAETGTEAARHHGRIGPLGLILTPGPGGAAGVESRWHFAPLPSDPAEAAGGRRQWRLERRRARMAPPAAWLMQRAQRGEIRLAPLPSEG